MTRVYCGVCGELKRVDKDTPYWYAFDRTEDGCAKCQPEDRKEDLPEDLPEDIEPDIMRENK